MTEPCRNTVKLHPNLHWHTLGDSRDRRQWGSMWNVLPPEPFLHWLLLAAARSCQHVRHRHPLGHCFTQPTVTYRKNHKAIIQAGAITEDAPRFPSPSLSPGPLATKDFWHVPFFCTARCWVSAGILLLEKDWCFWLIWTCDKPCFRMISSSLCASKASWRLLTGVQEKRV